MKKSRTFDKVPILEIEPAALVVCRHYILFNGETPAPFRIQNVKGAGKMKYLGSLSTPCCRIVIISQPLSMLNEILFPISLGKFCIPLVLCLTTATDNYASTSN